MPGQLDLATPKIRSGRKEYLKRKPEKAANGKYPGESRGIIPGYED
jgi:hypothetical protein